MKKIATSEFRRRFCSGHRFVVSDRCEAEQDSTANILDRKEYNEIIVSLNPDVIIFTSSATSDRLCVGIISGIFFAGDVVTGVERYVIEFCTGGQSERLTVDVLDVK